MKAMPVLLAGIAIIAIFLLGFSSIDNNTPTESVDFTPIEESNDLKRIMPKTLSASQTIGAVDSQDFDASNIRTSHKYDIPDLIPKADARIVEEITVNRWTFNDVYGYTTFDSAGNIFTHDRYRVARIDTANNTQTTWTAPEGWNLDSLGAVSDSGHYYFIANGNLTSLDPDTGVFTQWNVGTRGLIYSIGDDIYFSPEYSRILAENHSDYFDVTHIRSFDEYLSIYGVGAVGHVDIELVSPSNRTYNVVDGSNESEFSRSINVFSNPDTLSNDESGIYTIRVTNQNRTVEKTFEISELPFEFGERVLPPYIFLQKLTPDDATVTSYHIDSLQSSTFYISTYEPDGSIYFNDIRSVGGSDSPNTIMKFEPNILDITQWSDLRSYKIVDIGVSHNGDNIYWGYGTGRNAVKLVNLNTQDGILTETTVPRKCNNMGSVVVDSLDNVFFYSCGFYKYVPSTNTFTSFNNINIRPLKIDTSDVIYVDRGTATFATRIVPIEVDEIIIDPITTIRIQTDSILTGNAQVSDFTVSNNTVSRVDLKGSDVIVTVGTPILPGNNDVTISYSGSSIGDGTAQLEPFTDEYADNEIEPNILDIDIMSPTQIRITTDNTLVWDSNDYNQRTTLFTVSDNTVEDVEIQDKTILITVGTPIMYGDTVMVSYTNYGAIENIASRSLEPFTNMPVTNNIPQILDN